VDDRDVVPADRGQQAVEIGRSAIVPGEWNDLDPGRQGEVDEGPGGSDDRRFAAAHDVAAEQVNPLSPGAAGDHVVEQTADRVHSQLAGLGHALGYSQALSTLSPSELAPNLLVGVGVKIADGVEIGANVVLHDDVTVGERVQLEHGAVLGSLARRSRRSRTPPPVGGPTVVEAGAIVCLYAEVSAGARMGPHSFLGDHAHLREGVRLGADVTVGAGCGIGQNVEIGDRTRMQNHVIVGPGIVIEPDCFLGPGAQVLTGRTMSTPARVAAPILRRGCQIGAGAQILPGVEVGEEAIIGAGSVVAENVPPGTVVRGVPARLRDYEPAG